MADSLLYLAFGSMCNPISLARRGLKPSYSQPAVLEGFQLVFQLGGMANILEAPGSKIHGVLHRVTQAEFEVLTEIESNYETVSIPVTPYTPHSSATHADSSTTNSNSNSTVTATAFIVRPPATEAMLQHHPEWANSLPSDRYIRIITAGLKHYGADPAWVDWVESQPCKHGRQPHEYLKLPLPPSSTAAADAAAAAGADALPTFTMQQLSAHQGQLRDNKTLFAIGRKVVQVDVSSKPDAPFVKILQQHYAGRQAAFHMCMMLYEPRLPPLSCPADVCQQHIDWAEDASVEWLTGQKFDVQQVGWLVEDGESAAAGSFGGPPTPGAAAGDADVVRDAVEALHEEDEATTAPDTGVLV